jgi:hypothetical protein
VALHKEEHTKVWWWLAWPFMAGAYALFFPIAYFIWPRHKEDATSGTRTKWPKGSFIRRWEDYIDDPIDWLKKKLFDVGTYP